MSSCALPPLFDTSCLFVSRLVCHLIIDKLLAPITRLTQLPFDSLVYFTVSCVCCQVQSHACYKLTHRPWKAVPSPHISSHGLIFLQ